MTRWILAGVLLVILLGLVLADEFSAAPEPTLVGAAPEVEGLEPPPPPPSEPDPAMVEKQKATEVCADVYAALVATVSTEYADRAGAVLYDEKAMTPDQVAAFCTGLAGKSGQEIVDATVAATGVSP